MAVHVRFASMYVTKVSQFTMNTHLCPRYSYGCPCALCQPPSCQSIAIYNDPAALPPVFLWLSRCALPTSKVTNGRYFLLDLSEVPSIAMDVQVRFASLRVTKVSQFTALPPLCLHYSQGCPGALCQPPSYQSIPIYSDPSALPPVFL